MRKMRKRHSSSRNSGICFCRKMICKKVMTKEGLLSIANTQLFKPSYHSIIKYMKDKFEREINYLRLSVTDLCNLRCIYCMPESGITKLPHDKILSIEEIEDVVTSAADLGITKVRLTGGEPLVRKGIEDIISRIGKTPGINDIGLTTNGLLLPEKAQALKEAGVKRINISLDTLDPEKYAMISRGGDLEDALKGIRTAKEYGFDPIKINVVLMGGINDDEIKDFAEFGEKNGINIRFIEIMPIGECAGWNNDRFISVNKVLEVMPDLEKDGVDGVSTNYRVPGHRTTIGLISPISSHFCPDCNKLRITSDGKLKPCLHTSQEIVLKGLDKEEIKEAMTKGIDDKPKGHSLSEDRVSGSLRNMNAIGG